MSTDVVIWFSASQLALFGKAKIIPGMPGTERNAREFARRAAWPQRDIEGRGGAGGMRTEYQPPAPVLALIQSFLETNPDFFEKSKTRKDGFRMPIRSDEKKEAERLRMKTLFDADRIESEIQRSFGDEPKLYAQNPNVDFEAMLKRVAEATRATVRISKQFDFALPVEWTSLIQELMAMHGLTEAGAKRVIEALKQSCSTAGGCN